MSASLLVIFFDPERNNAESRGRHLVEFGGTLVGLKEGVRQEHDADLGLWQVLPVVDLPRT